MEFSIKSGSPEKQRSACVVVGVFDNRKLSLSAELVDRASNGYISEIIRRGDMEGKLGATLLLHNVRGTLADRVLLVGLGSLAAYLGGAPMWRGAARVAFWGAMAMGATALVGKAFGTVV